MTARAPLPPTPRKAMTPARRARIEALYEGCATVGCDNPGPYEIDHLICLELGGKDSDENLRPLCADCHKKKTRLDAKLIARARRRREKHAIRKGPDAEPRTRYRPSRQINSRGFSTTLTKGFDGKVRHRPTLKGEVSRNG
jgi:hypothetical protein